MRRDELERLYTNAIRATALALLAQRDHDDYLDYLGYGYEEWRTARKLFSVWIDRYNAISYSVERPQCCGARLLVSPDYIHDLVPRGTHDHGVDYWFDVADTRRILRYFADIYADDDIRYMVRSALRAKNR